MRAIEPSGPTGRPSAEQADVPRAPKRRRSPASRPRFCTSCRGLLGAYDDVSIVMRDGSARHGPLASLRDALADPGTKPFHNRCYYEFDDRGHDRGGSPRALRCPPAARGPRTPPGYREQIT
jgi:hypothetical protein